MTRPASDPRKHSRGGRADRTRAGLSPGPRVSNPVPSPLGQPSPFARRPARCPCPRQGSNLHVHTGHANLNRGCLPFSPRGPPFLLSRTNGHWLCGAKIRHAATAPSGTDPLKRQAASSDARESNAVFPDPKSGGLPSPSHPWGVRRSVVRDGVEPPQPEGVRITVEWARHVPSPTKKRIAGSIKYCGQH